MAPDIYNTVAPTRPAQTRSRAVARPPLGKKVAVAPHATGGGHGVMPRARRPLAVGVLIGAARTTGDLPPRIPSRGWRVREPPQAPLGCDPGARLARPRAQAPPCAHAGPPHGDAFGATLEPSVPAAPLETVATIARSQRTKYLTSISREGAIWFQGELVSRSQAYFPRERPVPHVHLYVWEIVNSGFGRSLARRR